MGLSSLNSIKWYLRMKHLCKNTHFTQYILQHSCFNLTCYLAHILKGCDICLKPTNYIHCSMCKISEMGGCPPYQIWLVRWYPRCVNREMCELEPHEFALKVPIMVLPGMQYFHICTWKRLLVLVLLDKFFYNIFFINYKSKEAKPIWQKR